MTTPSLRAATPASPALRSSRRIRIGNRLARWDVKASPYLYISPFFILFAIVGLFPLVYTGYVALLKFDPILHTGTFVGFDNFVWVFQQRQFWIALRNTLTIFLLSAVPQIIIALAIAAVLDSNLKAKTFWRMGVLLPYIVMPVAVALIFSKLFSDNYGLVNHVLGFVGIPAIHWHTDTLPAQMAIATMVNFRWTGYNALILLAGMQAIPRDLYEQASIECRSPAPLLLDHHSSAASDPDLRHHHGHDRWSADLRRTAAVRGKHRRPRWRQPAMADDDGLPAQRRVVPRRIVRPSRRGRLAAVPPDRADRSDQPGDHQAHRRQ